jgi:hypothetical protein
MEWMKKTDNFDRSVFSADVIYDAMQVMSELLPSGLEWNQNAIRSVTKGSQTWSFDTDEEFLAEYRREPDSAHYYLFVLGKEYQFELRLDYCDTSISVKASQRWQIEKVFGVFEKHREVSLIPLAPKPEAPPQPPPVVFIGHGRSGDWRDLKDHLHEQHGYAVEAYEIGSRAGHVIRDILEEMMARSSFAVLVMTGEDETASGQMRPRQNVVHEAGLFQGKLGFGRAIVVVEEGIEDFSNLQGVHQIRYTKGNIKETFGDVLATLRREFGST